MEPITIPDLEKLRSEGWVVDKGALLTLFTLKGLRVGDELYYRGMSGASTVCLDAAQVDVVYRHYVNPECSYSSWIIYAWRRPKRG